jgi:hypothetical protein
LETFDQINLLKDQTMQLGGMTDKKGAGLDLQQNECIAGQ